MPLLVDETMLVAHEKIEMWAEVQSRDFSEWAREREPRFSKFLRKEIKRYCSRSQESTKRNSGINLEVIDKWIFCGLLTV